ncbi:hypothetical protein [Cryptosporangium arvum]|uniref:DUF308 domain-containing protein n=1 Tax=Cryptosporangium arvum DSM 44712 TaxID=927661 RepID=A0A010ZQD7_9ACTN|nr:hypothetical protein [Cryptosporangium arvum]EXG80889.1 hypothetical protein CryarDRAFT_1984 [Cryptosporangium arvum DSM 44712]
MTGTSGRPYRGRRDNGLDATEFVALADVDPRIGEHLLDVLGVIGIAAYLAPSADLNPVVRSTSLPARPTDRLWVDRDRLEEARGLLEAVQEDALQSEESARSGAPETGASRPIEIDVDVEWERIIAGYDATAAPDRPRRRALIEPPESGAADGTAESPTPGSGNSGSGASSGGAIVDGTAAVPALTDPTADPLPVRTPGTADQPVRPDEPAGPTDDAPSTDTPSTDAPATGAPSTDTPSTERPGPERPASGDVAGRPLGRDRLTGTDAPPSDFPVDEDEGYEPPPPPPLPRMSAPVIGALLAIAAGLVLLFRSDTLGLSEHVRLLLSLCGILGGAGALVWRLRDGWNDDDPDDGAVV